MTRIIKKKTNVYSVEHKPGEFIEIDTGGLPLSEAYMTLDGQTFSYEGDNGFIKGLLCSFLQAILVGAIVGMLIVSFISIMDTSSRVKDINTRLIIIEKALKRGKKNE